MMKRYGLWKLKQKVPILGSQDNGTEMEVVVFVVKLLKHCKACILLLNSLSIVRHVFYFMLFYSILFLFLFFIFFFDYYENLGTLHLFARISYKNHFTKTKNEGVLQVPGIR